MVHEVEKWLIIKELTASDDRRLPKQVTVLRKGKSFHSVVYVRGPKEEHKENPERISDLRKIVDLKKSADVEGLEVSPHMAHLLIQVYDCLSDDGRKKFASVPLQRLVEAGRR